ncbi:MAG: YegP family protein [Candidatus Riesia sp.]|nr:YegP family protein [Candidatus Riesia sp.]
MSLGQEASVEEEVKAHSLEFYKSKNNGKWYWRIKAANGNIIGASSQGYVRRDDCEYNSKSVAVSVVNHEFGN